MPADTSLNRRGDQVLGAFIDALGWDETLARIEGWASGRESRYVCICNAHSVVTAQRWAGHRQVINEADMATPDGAPVAWMLRRLGFAGQPRVSGPDLMWMLCERCAALDLPVYFYGSTPATLDALALRLGKAFPGLRVVGMDSPPFRPLSEAEDAQVAERINQSGAAIVFVSLGCPKQEAWMAAHRGRVHAVMIGVGAAFDFHAGMVTRAPLWMRENGLEWLHRLLSEPRRLWRRYFVTNSLFILGAMRQLLGRRRADTE